MAAVEIPIKNQPLRPLKRAEYDALVSRGVFERERVELVFGQVVLMSPIGQDHDLSVSILTEHLMRLLGERARVLSQASFAASDISQPEPDVFVTTREPEWQARSSRAFLVIETARSSLAYDRTEKARLYAASNVDEYWIVDLVHGVIEVHRDRQDGAWRSITQHARGEAIALLAFPDVAIRVDDVLPPPGYVPAT